MTEPKEPGWKRNGRNGPFDWWLSCQDHGYDYQRGCMSCSMVEDHNVEFQQKLNRESNAGVTPSTHQPLPGKTPKEHQQ